MAQGGTLAQKLSLAEALDCAHAVPGAGAVCPYVAVRAQGAIPGCDVCQLADVTATAVLTPGGQRQNERPHAAALGCDEPSGKCR